MATYRNGYYHARTSTVNSWGFGQDVKARTLLGLRIKVLLWQWHDRRAARAGV